MARFLSAGQIAEHLLNNDLTITPLLATEQVGSTVDLRLGTEFVVKRMDRLPFYDPLKFHKDSRTSIGTVSKYYDTVKIFDPSVPFILHPGGFALGCTLEYIRLPPHIGAFLEGRSGWAREGLNVHSTAGLIHPGHNGIIVFELQNLGTHPLPLYPGTRVAQLLLYELEKSSDEWSYDKLESAKYSGTMETSFGRPWDDWEFERLSMKIQPPPI